MSARLQQRIRLKISRIQSLRQITPRAAFGAQLAVVPHHLAARDGTTRTVRSSKMLKSTF
jgi:hypothetical protein